MNPLPRYNSNLESDHDLRVNDALVQTQMDIHTMPKYTRPETFDEKLYRKFTSEPLIPIGCAVTAYFLGSGIKSFYNRDSARAQKMMRARVVAQFTTIAIFIGYYGFNSFNMKVAPGYHPSTPLNEENNEK